MFNNLFNFLNEDFSSKDTLSIIKEYEMIPDEFNKGYLNGDENLVNELKKVIIKINSLENLTKEEKQIINSINCELISISNDKDFTLDDILDCNKSIEYNKRYYEYSFDKRIIPLTSKEFNKIIEYNYQKIIFENKKLSKEQADNFMSLILNSYDKENYNYNPKILIDSISSLSKYYLNEEKIGSVKVSWLDLKDINTWGQYGEGELDLNYKCIKGNIKNDYHMLETMFHEMTHAIQDKKNNDNFMEEIIQGKDMAIFQNSKGVSKKINYHLVSYETDARIKGVKRALDYINEVAPEKYDIFYDKMKKGLKRDIKNLDIDERLLFNEVTDVHEAFDHCKQDYRAYAVENFRMLSLEYNDDGSKKDLGEMILEYKKHKERYKNATSIAERKEQLKYINTYEILFNTRKSKASQTLRDMKSVKKLIDEKQIYKADIKTSLDFKNSIKRDAVFIKSRITSLISPNKLNKMKISNTKKIGKIYERYYDEDNQKARNTK